MEVGQNTVARMALNAASYAAVEALRDDVEWSTLRKRHIKATLRYAGMNGKYKNCTKGVFVECKEQ